MSEVLNERKTTKRDFVLFKKTCEELIGLLGMKDWNVCYEHKDLPGNNAEVFAVVEGRVATIRLATVLYGRDSVVDCAKHEVAHLLLETLRWIAGCRWCDESEVNLEVERIVMILEKVL